MITRQQVSDRLWASLNGRLTLPELMDWADNALVEGGFGPEEDIDMLIDVVKYLAAVDTEYFPLTLDISAGVKPRLGTPVKVVLTSAA